VPPIALTALIALAQAFGGGSADDESGAGA